MNGAEYIAEFLSRMNCNKVFVLTGGACAFMIDAVARHPKLSYMCFQHEQAAAMAADALWRVSGRVGVTMATSGPGATNLVTGICCSYFDSIPTIHITGQVNRRESAAYLGANVRQAGFQETKIVDIVRPVTKYACLVETVADLKKELAKAYSIATTGRMGPVLLDVPMNVQQEMVSGDMELPPAPAVPAVPPGLAEELTRFLAKAERPLVLLGGGVGLAGVERAVVDWLLRTGLPFVSSWSGLGYFDHDIPNFCGQIGVYGNRGANFILQNCDTLLVLGSRLDNRQRSGNSKNFACGARVHVVDIDAEELKKYQAEAYGTNCVDLKVLPAVLGRVSPPAMQKQWTDYVAGIKKRYYGREVSTYAQQHNTLSPYDAVRHFYGVLNEDAIVIPDAGAALCWVYQAIRRKRHTLFTAAGNSPMGYAIPAAIGAKVEAPGRQVVAFIGDGSFQINIQELQTIAYHKLDLAIVIMNNDGYGIIKQFQDSYLSHRYHASGIGYSNPDFGRVAAAYGIGYARVERLQDISADLFRRGPIVIDVILDPNTLIEPKLEMGRPINDQYPYLPDEEYRQGNRFVDYKRPVAGG